jgi:hypothetical protein
MSFTIEQSPIAFMKNINDQIKIPENSAKEQNIKQNTNDDTENNDGENDDDENDGENDGDNKQTTQSNQFEIVEHMQQEMHSNGLVVCICEDIED